MKPVSIVTIPFTGYVLCEDVELIRQPYGAAIWKDSIGDFAVTNHTGRMILEACAKITTTDAIVRQVSSEIGCQIPKMHLKSDIEEFLACAERMRHVSRCSHVSSRTGSVTGSIDRLSLVRADLSITWRCNLRCRYCYAGSDHRSTELSTREWQDAFRKLQASGARRFIITGGEPFARPDMLCLLQTADDLGISVTLLTNGTLVDEALARRLMALKHLREVKISLDSVTSEKIHDRLRGAGTWHAAIRSLQLLKSHGIKVVVNMTIHPLNSDDIFLAAAKCAQSGWLLEASPVVLEGLAKPEHLLTSPNRARYQQQYLKALSSFPDTLRVNDWEISPEWEPSFRCAMLFGTIGVSPDGTLKPCLRSEAFFRSLNPMFQRTPSIVDLHAVDVEDLEFFHAIENVRSSFVPQPTECGSCKFLHGTCNGCVVAKSIVQDAGYCPRKEVIGNEGCD